MNLLVAILRLLLGIWPFRQTQLRALPTNRQGRQNRLLPRGGEPNLVTWMWLPILGWRTVRRVSPESEQPWEELSVPVDESSDRGKRTVTRLPIT